MHPFGCHPPLSPHHPLPFRFCLRITFWSDRWGDSCAGNPAWDPANIDVPTLVVRGTEDVLADRPGSLDHYDELTVERADYVELAGADHYAMHSERRQDLFETVHDFQTRVV